MNRIPLREISPKSSDTAGLIFAAGLGLEGCTSGITAAGCISGSHGDLLSGAAGFTVVMNTVLHIAANTLDVITATFLVTH